MDFNNFLSLAVAAILLSIAAYTASQIVPGVRAWIVSHLDARQRELIDDIFRSVVASTEYQRLKIAAEGVAFDALEYAIGYANAALARYNIHLDEALIAALLRDKLGTHMQWNAPLVAMGMGDDTKRGAVVQTESAAYWA